MIEQQGSVLMVTPRRGGNRNNAGNAGPSALNLNNSRTNANTNNGARPRFQFTSRPEVARLRARIQRPVERMLSPRRKPKNHKVVARGTARQEACHRRLFSIAKGLPCG